MTFRLQQTSPKHATQMSLIRMVRKVTKPFGYRGFGMLTNFIGTKLFNPSTAVSAIVHDDRAFRVFLNDPYWMLPLLEGGTYETEVGNALKRLLSPGTIFLDCGANHGYWSLLGGSLVRDPNNAIAVEPSAATFKNLEFNCQSNQDSFTCIRAAIAAESGKEVQLQSVEYSHAGAFVDGLKTPRRGTPSNLETVQTVAIDELVRDKPTEAPICVKLDVEGSEIEALKGSASTLGRNVVFIYEDLVGAGTKSVGDYFLSDLSFAVFSFESETSIKAIQSTDELLADSVGNAYTHNYMACPKDSSFCDELNKWCRS